MCIVGPRFASYLGLLVRRPLYYACNVFVACYATWHVSEAALSRETINRAQADFLMHAGLLFLGAGERTLSDVALSYFGPREDGLPRTYQGMVRRAQASHRKG